MKHKQLAKGLLVMYLLVLIWILLFKFSTSFSDIFMQSSSAKRSINLIPFSQSVVINGKVDLMEIIYNGLIFVPFGSLLGIAAKKYSRQKKVFIIAIFSFGIEAMQYLLALGATDVTDFIMNLLGGVLGLLIYEGLRRIFLEARLDRFLTIAGTIIFSALLTTILFVLLSQQIIYR